MPFTGAHPLAVLPLLRTPLPASALVVGSLVPDLPLYVPAGVPVGAILGGHTAIGLLTVDLPVGLLMWLVWHALLAPAAHAAAPAGLRARLADDGRPGLRRRLRSAWLVPPAIVAGAATHVLWDEFTHAGRWGERHLPVLAAVYGDRPGWLWAQYVSGVLGLALLALWLRRWWVRTEPAPGHERRGAGWPWAVIAMAGTAVAAAAALRTGPPLRDAAVAAATRGGTALALAALVLAVGWRAREALTGRGAGADADGR